MAKAKTSTRTKVGGTSKLKSNSNNKLIIVIVVLMVALMGGFFVYRSFAAGPRRVFTGADKELKIYSNTNSSIGKLMRDGNATVIELKNSGLKHASIRSREYRWTTSKNGQPPVAYKEEVYTNIDTIASIGSGIDMTILPRGDESGTNNAFCAYVAVLDANGQSVTAEQIASDHPGAETRLVMGEFGTGSNVATAGDSTLPLRDSFALFAKPESPANSSFTWSNKSGTKKLPMQSHVLGGKDSYAGVGPYRKYCWTVRAAGGVYTLNKLEIVKDGNLNSIFDKGYSIRILKIVYNDTPADEPASSVKTPYR